MSIKGSTTTASYMDFDKLINLGFRIIKNESNFKIGLIILVGANTGLRASDILSLRHFHLNNTTGQFSIREKKTGKKRIITINDHLKRAYSIFLSRCETPIDDDDFLFVSQKNTVYTVRSINRLLKEVIPNKKGLNVSSHLLRKSFGRAVWEKFGESEKSLIYLSEIFNHSSISLTRRYLGIRQSEISNIYTNL
nr:tyrosine-type recombinase/integrase [uncultured Carboxylicivirga sp.]